MSLTKILPYQIKARRLEKLEELATCVGEFFRLLREAPCDETAQFCTYFDIQARLSELGRMPNIKRKITIDCTCPEPVVDTDHHCAICSKPYRPEVS